MIASASFQQAKKIALYAALAAYCVGLSGVLPVHAQGSKEIGFKVQNLTQGGDATVTTAKVGDVISFTMDVKNTSSEDLKDYLMKVSLGDWLKTAKITDLGGGRIEGTSIVFPAILQAAGCNCTNTNTFKMKISSCEADKLLASYEDAAKTVNVECPKATASSTPIPGQSQSPAPTTTTPTGPNTTWAILGSLLVVGVVMGWKKRSKRV